MLAALAASVLVGKPFYPETLYEPKIEIAVNERSRDKREAWESKVVVSELRHAEREPAYFIRHRCRVAVLADSNLPLRFPAYRYGHNGPWRMFPRGTFAAPGTFTLSLYCELRWQHWRVAYEQARDARPYYETVDSYLSLPPDCWRPSGFEAEKILEEMGLGPKTITGSIEP